ncbi:NADPH:quinone reductase [Novosphingobium flavum]|uniref:NADPH:quinone reductase n=1 Tax=Sphingomonadales TaxID=204457 RepID=UPI000DC638C7|nr:MULTISPECIES: NADPH:quinone reductase [Sphingomonadaceae]MBC2663326.1 NADPH:quinone reductase [Novosphingobium aerophilum]BBB14201.1 NADPH:quinone oxidoreductase [Sphingopyxis sp. FD7]
MRGVQYNEIGEASRVLALVDGEMPTVGVGEVRVNVKASGVNPSDVKIRSGHIPSSWLFPRVPHSDGSGVIDAVGEGVDPARIGERVWVFNTAWGRTTGTAAEYVVVPENFTAPLHPDISFEIGACLGIPASTALHALTLNGDVRGKSVLVAGGAGAVGHYAVQFARQLGAECILATVSSPEKAEIARLAGADRVINYREEDSLKAILETTNGRGVDLILEVDLAANVDLDVAALAREGRVVAYGSSEREFKMPFSKSILKNIGFDFFILYHLADSRRLEISNGVNDLIESGNIDHNIAEVLPLDSIVKAHELVESGKVVGNVVVAI